MHDKRVCKNFEIQNLGQYYDFYLKCDKRDFGINFQFRKLQKNGFKNLSLILSIIKFSIYKISFSPFVSMASSFKKDGSKIKAINWY